MADEYKLCIAFLIFIIVLFLFTRFAHADFHEKTNLNFTVCTSVTPIQTITPTPDVSATPPITASPSASLTPTSTPSTGNTPASSGAGSSDGLSDHRSDGLCSKPPCVTPGEIPQGAPNTGRGGGK